MCSRLLSSENILPTSCCRLASCSDLVIAGVACARDWVCLRLITWITCQPNCECASTNEPTGAVLIACANGATNVDGFCSPRSPPEFLLPSSIEYFLASAANCFG